MNAKRISAKLVLVAVACAGFWGWAVYNTLIEGTTKGPDFIGAMRLGEITAETITSVEIVEPPVGFESFTLAELAALKRKAVLTSASDVSRRRLLALLNDAKAGRKPPRDVNHPGSSNQVYMKITIKSGFFWLYAKVLEDKDGAWLEMRANNLNATNPNGATDYHLEHFANLLQMLGA